MRSYVALAAVLVLGGLAAGCTPSNEKPDEPAIPAVAEGDGADPQTAPTPPGIRFECEDAAEISAVFVDNPMGVTLTREGAAPLTLALKPDGEAMAYSDGTTTFTLLGGDATVEQDGKTQSCTAATEALPPPVVSGAVRDLRADDNGAEVSLKAGDAFTVSLSGVPTAGYQWMVDSTPDFVSKTGETGGATSTAQFLPGFAGGSHWEVLVFSATGPGEGDLVLAQRRPWEDASEPAADTFSVHLKVE